MSSQSRICGACKLRLQEQSFSNAQLKVKTYRIRCKICIERGVEVTPPISACEAKLMLGGTEHGHQKEEEIVLVDLKDIVSAVNLFIFNYTTSSSPEPTYFSKCSGASGCLEYVIRALWTEGCSIKLGTKTLISECMKLSELQDSNKAVHMWNYFTFNDYSNCAVDITHTQNSTFIENAVSFFAFNQEYHHDLDENLRNASSSNSGRLTDVVPGQDWRKYYAENSKDDYRLGLAIKVIESLDI